MKLKKWIAGLLGAAMLTTCFAGCGGGGEQKDAAKNDAAADQNKTPADTKAAPAAKPGKKKNPDQKTAPQENKGADQTGKPGKK